MIPRLPILAALALACTPSPNSTPSTNPSTTPSTVAEADASPSTTTPSTPYYVMLGAGSRTKKPVANALLAHSWGWGTATPATLAECEANATSVGQQMWCSTESKPPGAAKLLRSLRIKYGQSAFVTPEQVAAWKIPAPPPSIWLISTTTICQAEVGRPMVGYYGLEGLGYEKFEVDEEDEDDEEDEEKYEADQYYEGDQYVGDVDLAEHFVILELAWELSGCEITDPGTWAPIGLSAEPESGLRWQPAQSGPLERSDPKPWTELVGEATRFARDNYGLPSDAVGPDWWTQLTTIPGTEVEERYVAALWRAPDSERSGDDYGCNDFEYEGTIVTRAATEQLAAQFPLEVSRSLTGALVGAGQVRLLVWDNDYDYFAAWLTDRLGETIELPTGVYHPESYGSTGHSLIGYCGP